MSNDNMVPKMPDVKFNKNGYEIRSDILGMAHGLVYNEFQYKWQGWELTSKRDEKTGQLISTVEMPQVPCLEKVLETAQKMYEFVNAGNTKNK